MDYDLLAYMFYSPTQRYGPLPPEPTVAETMPLGEPAREMEFDHAGPRG